MRQSVRQIAFFIDPVFSPCRRTQRLAANAACAASQCAVIKREPRLLGVTAGQAG
jgi:hypothetical protein